MPKTFERMNEDDLNAILDERRAQAEIFEKGSEGKARRTDALAYIEGKVDFKHGKDRSRVTDRTVSDTLGMVMPSLMRIFLASDRIAVLEPATPQDEEGAAQGTDYLNYTVMRECDGYRQIRSALYDGLALGNGILKHWWDKTPVETRQDFTGLTSLAYDLLRNDPEVEILEHEEKPEVTGVAIGIDPLTGMPIPPPVTHDCTVKRTSKRGRLRLVAVPQEEIRLDNRTTIIDEEDCSYIAHVTKDTRSNLIAQGYKKAIVLDIPLADGADYRTAEARYARGDYSTPGSDSTSDPAMETVEIEEAFIKVDYDGDGVAEWRRVVRGSSGGAVSGSKRFLLYNEEWGDDLPFSDLVPDPVPHRWHGRSIYDLTKDIQDVKTFLLRATLDSARASLEPRWLGNVDRIRNPDALYDWTFGEIIQTEGDPTGILQPVAVPFIAKDVFPVLEYMGSQAESRTGVSRISAAADLDQLQNQTATATNAAMSASHAKVEEYARNIAEVGLKRAFKCMFRLIVKHQDKPRMIRLRDKWVEMDPRSWNAEMDVTVNTGLGSGSRERDLAMLTQIYGVQKEMAMTLGPDNPVCGLTEIVATLHKAVESGGIRSPEQFFKEVDEQKLAAWQQQKAEAAANAPNPEMQKAQAALQAKQAELEMKAQSEQQKLGLQQQKNEADMAAKVREAEFKAALAEREAASRLQIERERMQAEFNIETQKMRQEWMLRMREQTLEAALSERQMAMNAKNADTNIDRN